MKIKRLAWLLALMNLVGCASIPIFVQQEAPPNDPAILRQRLQSQQTQTDENGTSESETDPNSTGSELII